MQILIDGTPIECSDDDSVLLAMLRAGTHPTGGGCLCLAGDCPHCLATVDGVGYTRTCRVKARDGLKVERHHADGGLPPLLGDEAPHSSSEAIYRLCDAVVIGQGESGREAAAAERKLGRNVITLDAEEGQEVAGVYAGPVVVASTPEGTMRVHANRVIVATGASEIQPVAPGSHLAGLTTARAASELAAAGVDLGRIVAVGTPPEGLDVEHVDGELVRFEGEDGRVVAVVVRDGDGREHRHACETVSLGLGLVPRDALFRMGRGLSTRGEPVRVVGDAARASDVPPCPRAGTVCPCSGVTVEDLEHVWDQGFHELELVKRATLAGTGTCQGSVCTPHVRSFLQEKGKTLQAPFTARPLTRQLTFAEISAGAHHHATPRTALHDEHLLLGAQMERSGGWWRPWRYADPDADAEADSGSDTEYRAVREGVSICDVSTLGKFLIAGPDALAFLEHLYPTRVATLRPGRSRYVLLLDERGYVLDDGMICREPADEQGDRYYLTLTSAGSSFGEMWLRDWAEGLGFDVLILNQTASRAAINVTGPRAAELLMRAGVRKLPRFARHLFTTVADIECRVLRLSFTGELSYELHVPPSKAVRLWRVLLRIGRPMDVRPHGLEALMRLRLEKGHLLVGQDTAFDSTPRRLDHEWAVRMDKESFVGRPALARTDKIVPDRRLVGLEMERPAPPEGAVIRFVDGGAERAAGEYAGYVTSSTDSPALGKAVMLAWVWLDGGEPPREVEIDGRTARLAETPFYDPKGERAKVEVGPIDEGLFDDLLFEEDELYAPPVACEKDPMLETTFHGRRIEPLGGVRVMASPEVLNSLPTSPGSMSFRIAPDELVVSEFDAASLPEGVLQIVDRFTGLSMIRLPRDEAERFLERACAWKIPPRRPAFVQGEVAGIPVHLRLDDFETWFIVRDGLAVELAERMGESGGSSGEEVEA